MAAADNYLCDVCGAKAFYDTDVNYDRVGDMACICTKCAKTHAVRVVLIDPVPAVDSADDQTHE